MSTRERRRTIEFWNTVRFLRKHFLVLFSLVLFAIAIFFYIQAEAQRQSLQQTQEASE